MSHILILVCHSDRPSIDRELIDRVSSSLNSVPRILAERIAVEWSLKDESHAQYETLIRPLIGDHVIDTLLVPAAKREKQLLLADMDSTIIEQECLDELAAHVGMKDQVAAITERAMAGELDFAAALRERVALLKGLNEDALRQTLENNISLTVGAETLVRTMNSRGAMTALVSGGFTYFTHRIALATGFQENQGNTLGIRDGKLTGEVEEPIFGKKAKREALETICTFEGIDPADAIAVGDGANDLDMLSAAGTGVAFHAKPAVAKAADVSINHADLTALLYAQGIPQSEFVTA